MASRRFQTTRWSLVLAAGDDASPSADAALAALCGQYWSVVYAFVRARGHDADAAADLTQAFFTRLLEREYRDVGKAQTFARLRGLVTGDAATESQRAIGADLAMSEGAVSVALHRLRRRYAEALRAEIAQTVDRQEDVADEIRYLLSVLARSRS